MRLPAAILLRSPKGGGGGGGRGGSSSSKGSSSSSNKSGSSKSGSSSSGSTGGSRPVGGYYNGSGGNSGGGGAKSKLPWWAIFLIVYFSLFFTVFLVALCYYCIKERRRKKEDNQPIRAGHVVWKAFCVASGLWLVIWLVKRCRGDRKARKGLTRTGTYSKIQEGHGDDHSDGDREFGARAVGDDAAGPQAQAHRGGDAKYDEPLGYGQQQQQQQSTRYWPREQPIITGPVEQTSAIPIPSPTASPAPSIMSARSAPPPPYTGPPASGLAPAPGPDVNKSLPVAHQVDQVPRPAPAAAVPPSSLFGSSIESPAATHNMYAQGGSYNTGYSGPQGGAY